MQHNSGGSGRKLTSGGLGGYASKSCTKVSARAGAANVKGGVPVQKQGTRSGKEAGPRHVKSGSQG